MSVRAGPETFVTQSSEFRPIAVTWRVEKRAAMQSFNKIAIALAIPCALVGCADDVDNETNASGEEGTGSATMSMTTSCSTRCMNERKYARSCGGWARIGYSQTSSNSKSGANACTR